MGRLARYARHLPPLIGVALLVGAIYVVQREFRNLRLGDVRAALEAIPRSSIGLAVLWTLISYGVLTFYDRLGTIYAGRKVSYPRVSLASFCAYALSHNLGFSAVSGAAVRYRLYANWGLEPVEIAKVVAFCSLTFGLGGMVLGGAILFGEPDAVPFLGQHIAHAWMYGTGAALWAVVAGYITLSRVVGRVRLFGHEATLPGWRMAILQVLVATADVAVTAAIFYALLPHVAGLDYLRFLGVYLASYSAGLLANLPGGIGVFDTAMLLGLAPYLPAPQVVGAILVFRLFYYIIPLFLAGSLFTGNEILLRGGALLKRDAGPRAQRLQRWSEPDFAVAAATGAVALCGAMLLALVVVAPVTRFDWIDPALAVVAVDAGQYVPSLIGTGLLLLALALARRVRLAWGVTIVLLLVGTGFTAAQGYEPWIPGVLALTAVLVAPFRTAFYRHARLFSGPLQLSTAVQLLALVICVLALAAFESDVRQMTVKSWWEIVLSPDLPNRLRVALGVAVVLSVVMGWRLLRPGKVAWQPWSADARRQYAALAAPAGLMLPSRADGLVMGEAGTAGLPFRRIGRVMLGLGDPVGAAEDRVSAIWRLRDLAQQEGLHPAFWNIGAELLPVYGTLGLTPLPLGPDRLPLPGEPREAPAERYLCCVAERDLHVLRPLLPELTRRWVREAAA